MDSFFQQAGSGSAGFNPNTQDYHAGIVGNANPREGTSSFIQQDIANPYFDRQNLATTTASFGAQSIPGAAMFQNQLFNPGFSPMEDAFMQNEAARQQRALNPAMARMQAQFGGTPFHSGMLNSFRELGEGMGLNLGNQALQLGVNRQGLAANAAGRIMGSPLDAAAQAQGATSDVANLTTNLFNSMYALPLAAANQSPIIAPSVISSGGGGTSTTTSSGGGKK